MANLNSFLADQFREYIDFRSSLGYSKKSLEERAATFDRFLYEQYPSHTRLSSEIIHKWTETRQNEHPNGKRARLYTTETFLKYLCETNYCHLHVPPEAIPRSEHFNPFIFSDRNLRDIFLAADTMPLCKLCPNREYVMPVMLRMMYCCALRPGEPFRLLRMMLTSLMVQSLSDNPRSTKIGLYGCQKIFLIYVKDTTTSLEPDRFSSLAQPKLCTPLQGCVVSLKYA